jgi:predicted RNase H-like HicB family nuclease
MLIQYIQEAMRHAKYELMENRRFFGRIPQCRGVWGEGKTLEDCREDLEGALQDWIVIKLRFDHKLPSVGSISIDPTKIRSYAEAH